MDYFHSSGGGWRSNPGPRFIPGSIAALQCDASTRQYLRRPAGTVWADIFCGILHPAYSTAARPTYNSLLLPIFLAAGGPSVVPGQYVPCNCASRCLIVKSGGRYRRLHLSDTAAVFEAEAGRLLFWIDRWEYLQTKGDPDFCFRL